MRSLIISAITITVLGCANPINQKTAEHYHDLGSQSEDAGDYELAEEYYSRALWNAKMGQSPNSGISMVYYNLGRVKGYLCKYHEAEELLLEALRLEEETSGPDSGLTSMRLFELGRLNAAWSQFDEALSYYSRAISLVRKLDVETSDPIGFANVLGEYAELLESSGNREKAISIGQEADRIRIANPDMQPGFVAQSYSQFCPGAEMDSAIQ